VPETPSYDAAMRALASIPSPASPNLGPFHMYGILLAIGVLVGCYVGERRWRNRRYAAGAIYDLAFWAVLWGVVGARLYHVITDYQLFDHDPFGVFAIWRGGLSIWGAVAGGGIAVFVTTRRRHLPTLVALDCMSVGLVLAQAIGRFGNYFNQELFGRPTDLPWGLEISLAHRPLGYEQFTTFQPTFLYESLACLLIAAVLVGVEHRFRLREGQTFALYGALYTFARFFFENLRIDPAHEIGPLRVNAWVSIVVFVASVVWFVWLRGHAARQRRPGPVASGDTDQVDAIA